MTDPNEAMDRLRTRCRDESIRRRARAGKQEAELKERVSQLQARVEALRGECSKLRDAYEIQRFLDPSEAHFARIENGALLDRLRDLRSKNSSFESTAAGHDQLHRATEDLDRAQAELAKVHSDNSQLQTNLAAHTERIRDVESALREKAREPNEADLNDPKLSRRRFQLREAQHRYLMRKETKIASYQKDASALENEAAQLDAQKTRLTGLNEDLTQRYAANAFGKAHFEAQSLDAQNKMLYGEIASLESGTVEGKAKLTAEIQAQIEHALTENESLTQQVSQKELHIRDLEAMLEAPSASRAEKHGGSLGGDIHAGRDLNEFNFRVTDADREMAEEFLGMTAEPRTIEDTAAVSRGGAARGDVLETESDMAKMAEYFLGVRSTPDSPGSLDDMRNRFSPPTPTSQGHIA